MEVRGGTATTCVCVACDFEHCSFGIVSSTFMYDMEHTLGYELSVFVYTIHDSVIRIIFILFCFFVHLFFLRILVHSMDVDYLFNHNVK